MGINPVREARLGQLKKTKVHALSQTERKFMLERENKKPCVALDVSKGSSHVQAFTSSGVKVTEVCVIKHTKSGFAKLKEIIQALENTTNRSCAIVFECTGAYSQPLEQYLRSIKRSYYMIPPLLSAKVRKSDIRPTKTDKKDCETIANVYYLKRLKETPYPNNLLLRLKPLCSYYLFLQNRLVELKIKFRQILDIVYPGIDSYFNSDSPAFVEMIMKNPDPNKLKKKSRESTKKHFLKTSYCGEFKANKLVNQMELYFCDAALNIQEEDGFIDILSSLAKRLLLDMEMIASVMDQICLLGMKTEEYKYLVTIPGISKQTASRIASEIGGIKRFPTVGQFIAYIGIDPSVHSSGKMDGKHLSITKKGNQRLRCLLYLVSSGTSKSKKEGNPVRDFILQKKSDGLSPKAAIIAGCNKLARIIYAVCSKREPFAIQ